MRPIPARLPLLLPLLILATALAAGAQAPRWGLSDQAVVVKLTTELSAILEQPATQAGGTRGDEPDATVQRALAEDPELAEAYRSDPAATLKLIALIRAAGGFGG